MTKPAGGATSSSCTAADGGGVTPLRTSLASTLGVTDPAVSGVAKISSLATMALTAIASVAVAVPHTAASGAGRQAW
ncbi:hypothetical protein [Stenotrophomonas cyclobalanopsidis]|uniref:hypothetical protein n=1 Tax=Stenotrophomonas cyclobalanopsidis TaxID=2771362 RepID=UPI00345FE485